MYFVYCDIAEFLPKAKIWCSSRGNDEQSTRRITLEVEAVFSRFRLSVNLMPP